MINNFFYTLTKLYGILGWAGVWIFVLYFAFSVISKFIGFIL